MPTPARVSDGTYLLTFGPPQRRLVIEDGIVKDAPPGMRQLVGKRFTQVEAWVQLWGGRLEREQKGPPAGES
jgi:hypothetical protein